MTCALCNDIEYGKWESDFAENIICIEVLSNISFDEDKQFQCFFIDCTY